MANNPEKGVARSPVDLKVSLYKCEKCFGPPFCVVARRAMERKEDLNRSFSSVVEYALKNKPHVFLISSDVFDKILPTNASGVFVTQEVRRLRDAEIPWGHEFYTICPILSERKAKIMVFRTYLNYI